MRLTTHLLEGLHARVQHAWVDVRIGWAHLLYDAKERSRRGLDHLRSDVPPELQVVDSGSQKVQRESENR